MAFSGPSTSEVGKKTAVTEATKEQEDTKEQSPNANIDTTSSIGDKNIIGLQGKDGSDTEYDTDEDKAPFVR